MEIFISQNYFPVLDTLHEISKEEFLPKKQATLYALSQLLLSLQLNCDIEESEAKKIATDVMGKKNYSSFKELVIANAIKNQTLNLTAIDESKISNHSAFYFVSNDSGNSLSKNHGVAIKDNKFDGDDFFDNYTIVDRPLGKGWEKITNAIPPCNSMLIVDKYIFGRPFQIKIKSLIDFISLYKGRIKIPFHLTIIFSDTSKGKFITNAGQIKMAFQKIMAISNIECQLFVNNDMPVDDRIILTNYTSGNIGHPFDDRPTKFNQNFLGHENDGLKIRRNYKEYEEQLRHWHNYIKIMAHKYSPIQTSWTSSKFQNRLFSFLDI